MGFCDLDQFLERDKVELIKVVIAEIYLLQVEQSSLVLEWIFFWKQCFLRDQKPYPALFLLRVHLA